MLSLLHGVGDLIKASVDCVHGVVIIRHNSESSVVAGPGGVEEDLQVGVIVLEVEVMRCYD